MYQVVIGKQGQKELAKIPPPDYNKVVAAVKDLATDPGLMAIKNSKAGPAIASASSTTASFTRSRIISSPSLSWSSVIEGMYMIKRKMGDQYA